MDRKKRFKLYKSGKQWCVAAILGLAISGGMLFNAGRAEAADDPLPSQGTALISQVESQASTDVQSNSTDLQQTVPQSQLIDNGNVASYSQQGDLQSYTTDSIVHDSTDQGNDVSNNLSTVNITGDFTDISKENVKSVKTQFKLNDGTTVDAYATIKYQGNSSLTMPKKSYRIKLYQDESLTKKQKIELPDSGFKTNAFNLKANFADPNASNNLVNAEIFKEITASRADLKNSIVNKMPNYGQVAGIPVSLSINGTYQGMYTLNTYHQDKLFKMDDEQGQDIAITGEGYDPVTAFEQPVTLNNFISASSFDNVSPAKVTQATVDRFNELYQLANANDADYLTLEQKYLDVPAAIDYIVFSMTVNNNDGLRKNIFYLSKDGGKWVLMPYDLDSSWGNLWDGSAMDPTAKMDSNFNGNRLLAAIYRHHQQEIVERYRELRQNVLSTANIIKLFNNWFDQVGESNYQADDRLWNKYNMSGKFTRRGYQSKQAIFSTINTRLKAVDQQFGISTKDQSISIPEQKQVTRTINLAFPSGSQVNKQIVTLTRTSHFDTATNKFYTSDGWIADQSLPAFTIPQISGYTAIIANKKVNQLPELTVNGDSPSTVVNVNYWQNPTEQSSSTTTNLAWIDQQKLTDNELQVTGWHVNDQIISHPYHYLIVYDQTSNTELGRTLVTDQLLRQDVKRAYNLFGAEYAGFSSTVKLNFDAMSSTTDQLSVVSRYSDNFNGEGNNIDYWNPSFTLEQSNNAYLDNFNVSPNNTLRASGWHATNQGINKPYHYVILFDQTTGRELQRQRVLNGVRTDVAAAYPNIGNGVLSGFTADFSLTGVNLNHNLQVISRYSNNSNGEGSYVDYWFSPVCLMPSNQQNLGCLDSIDYHDGELKVNGWHATGMTTIEYNHYLILFDKSSNEQVGMVKINNISRPDVNAVYPQIPNAGMSGFSANFGKLTLNPGHQYSVVSRYSSSDMGNGDAGIYTDYWFDLPVFNQQAFYIDNVQRTTSGLHLSGWMASDYSMIAPEATIIILGSNGTEVVRQSISLTSRPDVANAYPSIYNSQQSGFDTEIAVDQAKIANGFSVLLRFSPVNDVDNNYFDQLSSTYFIK